MIYKKQLRGGEKANQTTSVENKKMQLMSIRFSLCGVVFMHWTLIKQRWWWSPVYLCKSSPRLKSYL